MTARPPRPGKVTVKEVAGLARVSTGTVSNVLNHPELVSAETVHRVERAIEQLGWVRDQTAQQLRGGRSTAIGVVVAELSPHTIELLRAVEDHLDRRGYVPQVVTTAHLAEREIQRVELFEQQRARGILLSPAEGYSTYLHRLRQLEIPVVLLGQDATTEGLCSVSVDDVEGGRLAVGHLVERGHRRVVVAGGRPWIKQVKARVAGARAVLPADAELTVVPTDALDVGAGLAVAEQLLAQRPGRRPTAVFAVNDLVASGVQRGLQAAGLRIPDDVAVVGYDDTQLARTAPVALTSVRGSNADLGREAATLLLEEIRSAEEGAAHVHRQLRLQPSLVVRDST